MQTLTYGLQLPETGDKGSIFFPALEDNITQLDGHSHNGTDSAFIPSSSLLLTTQSILAANWVAYGSGIGTYRQLVTMPGTLTFDLQVIHFRDASTGNYYQGLTLEKASANTYYVYINDSTVSLTAYYV